ncbi:MAG: hypothetical protein IJP68_06055, partial [Selenomonadaceae bacterium]|nr:hypothetical protein [Selenomonadaceae bacterium]
MDKEFYVNDTLTLPENITRKNIGGFWIILAPDYPNWIILDDKELQMFSLLEEKYTIMQAMDHFFADNIISEDTVIKIMTKLLGK